MGEGLPSPSGHHLLFLHLFFFFFLPRTFSALLSSFNLPPSLPPSPSGGRTGSITVSVPLFVLVALPSPLAAPSLTPSTMKPPPPPTIILLCGGVGAAKMNHAGGHSGKWMVTDRGRMDEGRTFVVTHSGMREGVHCNFPPKGLAISPAEKRKHFCPLSLFSTLFLGVTRGVTQKSPPQCRVTHRARRQS